MRRFPDRFVGDSARGGPVNTIESVSKSCKEQSMCHNQRDRFLPAYFAKQAFAIRSILTFVAMVVVLCSGAMADITATVSGVVQDSSGAVLPGAQVLATNVETGIRTAVTTDAKGFYSLLALPIGTYNISVTKSGFKSYLQSGLPLKVNYSIRVDVTLNVGQTAE